MARHVQALPAEEQQFCEEIFVGLKEALEDPDFADVSGESIKEDEFTTIYDGLYNNIVSIDATQRLNSDLLRLMLNKAFILRFGRVPQARSNQ